MKYTLYLLLILALTACGNGTSSVTNPVATETPAASTGSPTPIARGLVFNYNVKDTNDEVGQVGAVWGSSEAAPQAVKNLLYISQQVIGNGTSPYTFAWFKANHPDWIEYQCDEKTPAYLGGVTVAVPVDFADPAVQQWILQTLIAPALAQGYAGIAFDNLWLYNPWGRCGHFDTNGAWVQQYSDAATYTQAVIDWAASMHALIHSYDASAIMALNYSYTRDFSLVEQQQLVDGADLWLDECGMSECGTGLPPADVWNAIFTLATTHQAHGGCYWSNNEFPSPDTSQQIWAVANYLLLQGDCTYLSIEPTQGYGTLYEYPVFQQYIGTPIGAAMQNADGSWTRKFSAGSVTINPITSSAEIN